MQQRTDITGIILAGGKSLRMGSDKALLSLGNRTLLQCVADAMKQVFHNVIIISDNGECYTELQLPVFPDVYKCCGPLGGIHSAFAHSSSENIFVVSCDLPYITPEVIQYITNIHSNGDVIIVSQGRIIQPLCGLYQRTCVATLEQCLFKSEFSVLRFLRKLNTYVLSLNTLFPSVAEHTLMNINTPIEYRRSVNYWYGN